MNVHNLPAMLRSLSEIVDEYDTKVAAIPQLIATFDAAVAEAEAGSYVAGTYSKPVFDRGKPSLSERTLRENLLQSAWRHVYNGLQLDRIAPASDRSRFETAIQNPAPFTLDNISATFGKYITAPRHHILRGLAECFSQLDPAFKSHDRMKIGVKGLPKRIILTSVTDYGDGWGSKRLKDVINALRVYNGQPHIEWGSKHDDDGRLIQMGLNDFVKHAKSGDSRIDNLTLRRFRNGNGHLFFEPEALRQINEALAEFYGEVLPDCPEERPKKAKSTELAKDLQFYRTPPSVADTLVSMAAPREGQRILEPSCGDGAILDALRRYASRQRMDLRATGIECDAGRATAAREKGYTVQVANFLQVEPSPTFDHVVMNPPFYGKHYQSHVDHARKFLKPGGRVHAILPVTAVTDHGYVEQGRWYREFWTDLPVGSFSESGTNINTGIAMFFPA